jgi:heptosyltransferase III
MPSALERLSHGSRVAVIRLRSLGDSVLTTPAIHILKNFRPDLEIGVVSESRFFPIFEGNPDIAAIIPPSLRELRKFQPSLTLNLHGGPRSARMTALSGARIRAGFEHFTPSFFYNLRIPKAQKIFESDRKVHTAAHVASAVFYLGVPPCEIPRARLFADPALGRNDGPYVVIHPFASEPAKTWPPRFFLDVAQHLKREFDLQPLFISGPGEDLSTFQMWPTAPNQPLGRIKQLISEATLFLGNDSGPAHMAAAFGIPVVVLFGPSDPVAWAPWRTQSEVLVSKGPIHSIAPQQVILALEKLRVHA